MTAALRSLSSDDLQALVAEVVGQGGCLPIAATGQSMRPGIRPGDRVVLGPLSSKVPRLGDVLLARTEHGLLLHRLVEIHRAGDGMRLVLRGDAESGPGVGVSLEDVLARLVHGPPRRRWGRLGAWPRWLRIVFRAIR